MVSIIFDAAIGLIVVCAFFVGLLKSRSRAIIHTVLFAAIFYGLRFLLKAETQEMIISGIFSKISPSIETTINGFINKIPDTFKQINQVLIDANSSIEGLNLQTLPEEITNGTIVNIIKQFVEQVIWFFLSFVFAFVLSLILSFIFNIPCKIAWNKRNTVVTTNEQNKVIKVKTKTKFYKRIFPAVINTVLTLFMISCVVSPVYEAKAALKNTIAPIEQINTTEIKQTIVEIREKRADYALKYGEENTQNYFADIDGAVNSIESLVVVFEEASILIGVYETSLDNLVPDIKLFNFLTLIKFKCFEVEINGEEVRVGDKLNKSMTDVVSVLNTDISKLNKFLKDILDKLPA